MAHVDHLLRQNDPELIENWDEEVWAMNWH